MELPPLDISQVEIIEGGWRKKIWRERGWENWGRQMMKRRGGKDGEEGGGKRVGRGAGGTLPDSWLFPGWSTWYLPASLVSHELPSFLLRLQQIGLRVYQPPPE